MMEEDPTKLVLEELRAIRGDMEALRRDMWELKETLSAERTHKLLVDERLARIERQTA